MYKLNISLSQFLIIIMNLKILLNYCLIEINKINKSQIINHKS